MLGWLGISQLADIHIVTFIIAPGVAFVVKVFSKRICVA